MNRLRQEMGPSAGAGLTTGDCFGSKGSGENESRAPWSGTVATWKVPKIDCRQPLRMGR